MVSMKKVIEAVLGGVLFGAVYSLCKFELDLEYEGVSIDQATLLGQLFWFVKVAIGLIASKYASQELIGLLISAEPLVESAVDVDGRRRSRSTSSSYQAFAKRSPIVTRGSRGVATPMKHKAGCPCC